VDAALLVIGILTLAVTCYVAAIATMTMRREGTADRRYLRHEMQQNNNAPLGWQVVVFYENTGPAQAHHPFVVLRAPNSPNRLPQQQWRSDSSTLLSGDDRAEGHDLPHFASTTPPRIWIFWQDSRGRRSLDTEADVRIPDHEPT